MEPDQFKSTCKGLICACNPYGNLWWHAMLKRWNEAMCIEDLTPPFLSFKESPQTYVGLMRGTLVVYDNFPFIPICPTPHLRESCIYKCTSLSLSLAFNVENPLQLKIKSFDIKISFKDVHLVWWVVIEMVNNKVIGKAYVWMDERFVCTCNKHKDMCRAYLSSIHVKSFPM